MKLAYISPSLLPSRSANSIHVLQQCEALGNSGAVVTLFAKRQTLQAGGLAGELAKTYGVDLRAMRLKTIYTPFRRGNNITIALYACLAVILTRQFDAVLSRNLFASFVLAYLWNKPLIIEVHQIEGGSRAWMQRRACRRPRVRIVTISRQLKADLEEMVGETAHPIEVLHDAAADASRPLSTEEKLEWREKFIAEPADRDKFLCGYVGHLFPGRGIEIIEEVARRRPDILFVVIGGNDEDIALRRRDNNLPNLRFLGHVPHPVAKQAMGSVDLLLMPYQQKVSIGVSGHDTGRWMSPLKMFEYMSSGTAFIASDLPVLREVLSHGENAWLVDATDAPAWERAINLLRQDKSLRETLARQAYKDYQAHYTWKRRAERLLALLKS